MVNPALQPGTIQYINKYRLSSMNRMGQIMQEPSLARLRLDFALYPITPDEEATCRAVLEQDQTAGMLLMPTHHISPDGDMMGFKYECGASQPGDALPFVSNMFFGHTAVECRNDDAAIMRRMKDPVDNLRRMSEVLQRVRDFERAADLQTGQRDSARALGTHAADRPALGRLQSLGIPSSQRASASDMPTCTATTATFSSSAPADARVRLNASAI